MRESSVSPTSLTSGSNSTYIYKTERQDSVIIHHPKLPLVILRTDYLAIAKSNYCAAKFLAVLENWTNWFVRQGKLDRWIRLPTEVISQHLLGEHNKAVIQKAATLLVSLGFIRREQRRKHRHDRSWFYWFDIERVQEAIDTLQQSGEPEIEEDYLKMEAGLETETRVVIDPPKMVNRMDKNQPMDSPKMVSLLNRYSNKNLNTANNGAVVELNETEEESTGILEEPQPDPITQIQQAHVQLLDKRELFDSLRLLGIETNESVRATMKKHAASIPNALAHIKQRYDSREKFGNITGAFVKACKDGANKSESVATWGLHAEVNAPSVEQLAALDEAKSRRAIADHFLSSDNIRKVVLPNGFTQMVWWEYLE